MDADQKDDLIAGFEEWSLPPESSLEGLGLGLGLSSFCSQG